MDYDSYDAILHHIFRSVCFLSPLTFLANQWKIISLDSKWCLVQTIRGECFCWCLHKTWTWTVPCFSLRKSLSSPLRSRCPCAQCPGGSENKECGCALCNGDCVCSLLTHFQLQSYAIPSQEDAPFIQIESDTRIQVLESMDLLPDADKEQCAAFIVSFFISTAIRGLKRIPDSGMSELWLYGRRTWTRSFLCVKNSMRNLWSTFGVQERRYIRHQPLSLLLSLLRLLLRTWTSMISSLHHSQVLELEQTLQLVHPNKPIHRNQGRARFLTGDGPRRRPMRLTPKKALIYLHPVRWDSLLPFTVVWLLPSPFVCTMQFFPCHWTEVWEKTSLEVALLCFSLSSS